MEGNEMRTLGVVAALVLVIFVGRAGGGTVDDVKSAGNMSALAEAMDRAISRLETQFVALAEAMPADKFDATPENMGVHGAFGGVRSFGEQVKHVAADNFA